MDGECDKMKADNEKLDQEIMIYEEMAINNKSAEEVKAEK